MSVSNETLLAGVPIFAELGRRDIGKLAALCMPKDFPAGTRIVAEGSAGLGMYVITGGSVEIYTGEGATRRHIAILGPGDIVGEMALVDDHPRSATALALADTQCLLITRDGFQTLVRRNAEIAWCIVPVLASRFRRLERRAADQLGAGRPAAGTSPPATQPATAPATGPAIETPADDARLRGLINAEYAAAHAGVEGLAGTARLLRTFLRALARETGLAADKPAREMMKSMPKALRSALADAGKEGERLPERMVAAYRRERRRNDET
jgi:CRP/FNR family cyclic AMP-dependent transcriptional regulator